MTEFLPWNLSAVKNGEPVIALTSKDGRPYRTRWNAQLECLVYSTTELPIDVHSGGFSHYLPVPFKSSAEERHEAIRARKAAEQQ